MPKQGELTYFQKIGDEGQNHAINKPFSDNASPTYFMDMGLMYSLFPAPPARVLECGCGTGWLSYFLARKGYEVVGQDCSADAIRLAEENPVFIKTAETVRFICSDFESLNYENEFDAVLFYASLHHSEDEKKAIECAYRALKKNGVFLAFEPSIGHKKHSQDTIEKYDTNDRDMPPSLIIKRGKAAGFRKCQVYLHSAFLLSTLYGRIPSSRKARIILSLPGARLLAFLFLQLCYKPWSGVVRMVK
ncbi:MAG: class I SAM-dependent methyltransferase [Chitinispirillaceae bacterium]|nr:class I SAM-dependent methyltransferase [Chitinispirillaceae bacterium]